MRRKVYRSLDRTATFFGIRGRFLMVVAMGGGLALILGMVVGAVTSAFGGVAAGLVGAVAVYFYTQTLQSRIDEKDFLKMLVRMGLPQVYRFPARHIRNIWKGFNLPVSPKQET